MLLDLLWHLGKISLGASGKLFLYLPQKFWMSVTRVSDRLIPETQILTFPSLQIRSNLLGLYIANHS